MLFNSTFDLITLGASNSLVAFCFCNLIIAILLVASSKPSSTDTDAENLAPLSGIDEENPVPLPGTAQRKKCVVDNSTNSDNSINMNEYEASREVIEAPSANDAVSINGEEDKNPDADDECRNGENDDELRRRVEEFIDKVNRGWKAENLRMYPSLGHRDNKIKLWHHRKR